MIAIYNLTANQLCEVETSTQVENYWRTLEKNEKVYTLTDYKFVDVQLMEGIDHDELIECGWEVLQ